MMRGADRAAVRVVLIAAACGQSLLAGPAAGVAAAQGTQPIWADEFNTLDTAVWQPMIGDGSAYGIPGWGNNELQYYTSRPQNVRIENGVLVIEARRESFGGRQYTSARLRTINRADFKYGRFEARMKLPSTRGIWPAWWMLPTNSPYGGWASSGEIDFMEMVNTATRIYGTLHFGAAWPNNTSAGVQVVTGVDYSTGFHVFRTDWYPDRIEWYIDDELYGRIMASQWFSAAAPNNDLAPFDQFFHMLLNVAVGGNFPGNPDGTSAFPQRLEVDYVRVYAQPDARQPYLGTPGAIPGRIQAEDYDLGGQGLAYNDVDTRNNGSQYRPHEGVDIEARVSGGHNVGYLRQGEWLEYTVDVQSPYASQEFTVAVDVASAVNGGRFRFELDGNPISPTVVAPGTNGWQNWRTVTTSVVLTPGRHVLRFANMGGPGEEFNIDHFTFTAVEPPCAPDLNADTRLDIFDVLVFFNAFASGLTDTADFRLDGLLNIFDITDFFAAFAVGCP